MIPGYIVKTFFEHLDNPIGLEIGGAEGHSSEVMLDANQTLVLYTIDPYLPYIDWHHFELNKDFQDNRYKEFLTRTKKFSGRSIHYKMTSDEALRLFSDNYFDFIFIDGLHTYDQVLKDCRNYYPKLKYGGVFSGHDYVGIGAVRKAVDEFAKEINKKVKLLDRDVWYLA